MPFVATVTPGTAGRPVTLGVHKAAIENDRHATVTWGAAHAGVAAGADGGSPRTSSPPPRRREFLLIAAVWANPEAADERLVFENNKEATLGALRAGRDGRPRVDEALAARPAPSNAYFGV